MDKNNNKRLNFLLYSSENITAMLFGLVGMALVARVFGPENMGRLSLVQAVSAIFMFLATFGLDHFVVRDFTVNKDDGELKGSLLIAQSFGWLMYVACVFIYFLFRDALADEFLLIVSVVISTYFLRVLFLKLYLQSINDAKSIAISAICSRIIALIYLVIGTYCQFSFEKMIFYLPLQAFVQALMMVKGYKTAQATNPSKMKASFTRIQSMLMESMPIMFSGAIYFAYNQADILIISHLMEIEDVGIYSAAMRLLPQAAFLGHITVITFYSQLSQHYHDNYDLFLSYAKKVLRIQIMIAFLMAMSFSLLAPIVIFVLYGEKFSDSAPVLAVGVWAWLFIFPASLFSRLLVLARLAKYDLIKTMIVAPLSLGLNFLLIPHYGYLAAAFVAVFSLMISDFLIFAVFRETRFIFHLALDAVKEVVFSPFAVFKESITLFKSKA